MSQWENLTSPDFKKEVIKSDRVCMIALGVVEKHGGHLPLGTDWFAIHKIAVLAAEIGKVVVFPPYYFTQILEAKHQPGTIGLSPEMILRLLENVCDEIGRNGFKKIILLNGHGGNPAFLGYFLNTVLLNKKKNYVVYYPKEVWSKWSKMVKKREGRERCTGHGGDLETSVQMAVYKELVKMKDIESPGTPLGRLNHLSNIGTSMGWYANYPRHYAGDAKGADEKTGRILLNESVKYTVDIIRKVKKDRATSKLYEEFFKKSVH